MSELEHCLLLNGGEKFEPLPYWDPSGPIPAQLNKNNANVNLPLPKNLRSVALKKITRYSILNNRILPYFNKVHDNVGGQMPNFNTAPSDPVFWPFHSFLLAVYEEWRSNK